MPATTDPGVSREGDALRVRGDVTGERVPALYEECWRRTMRATLAAGGGVAHHHGNGRVRRAFLADELGPAGVDVLRALKHALDPDDLMNPGVLVPPR